MNKYLALQKDVFDINKVTVVGSPNITSDGVASGLNANNYIVPFSDITLGDDFEMYLPFKLTSITSSRQLFYRGQNGSRFAFLLGADSYKVIFNFRSNLLTLPYEVPIIANVELNVDYVVKLKLKNGLLSYGYFKNNTYTHVGELETELVMDNMNWFRFGGASYTSAIINMPEFKIFINGQLAYTPTKPTYLLERRKPKVWNKGQFTIVGNPSISESGVASGFSASDYVYIPADIFPEQINSLVIEGEVTTQNLSTNQAIFGCKQNGSTLATPPAVLDIRLTLTGGQIVYSSGIDTQVAPTFSKTMNNNTNYKYKVEIIGTSIKFYLDGEAVFTANNFVYVKPSNFYIGVNRMLGDIFLGSINLKQLKIYTDNNLVFDGGADTYVYDASKFTIVGSPTITEYGVASGLNGANYLLLNNSTLGSSLHNANSWKIIQEFTYNGGGDWATLINCTDSRGIVSFIIPSENNMFSYGLSSDGINEDIANPWTLAIGGLVIGNRYKAVLKFTGTQYIHTLYNYDGTQFGETRTVASSTKVVNSTNYYIGKQNIVGGSIDLPSTSITVDGKEVFTGAKEQFYMLRR